MDLSYEPLDLRLREPFTIPRGTQLVANNVQVTLSQDGVTGIGEAAPSEHYGELQATVLAFLSAFQSRLSEIRAAVPLQTLHELMADTARLNPAARAGVDLATYDLLGKSLGVPVYDLLGLDPERTPRTSYTIGIDEPDVMARKAAEARAYPILKVKVGTARDRENLAAIRDTRLDAVVSGDSDETWTPTRAVRRIAELEDSISNISTFQRVVGGGLEGLRIIRRAQERPMTASPTRAAFVTAGSSLASAPFVDSIDRKLMKSDRSSIRLCR